MGKPASTPKPPYYAVIFTSTRSVGDNGYSDTAARMVALASQQPGFLGYESAREQLGITVSYWKSLDDIKAWKANAEHQIAQKRGREEWYETFRLRICRVEHEYGM